MSKYFLFALVFAQVLEHISATDPVVPVTSAPVGSPGQGGGSAPVGSGATASGEEALGSTATKEWDMNNIGGWHWGGSEENCDTVCANLDQCPPGGGCWPPNWKPERYRPRFMSGPDVRPNSPFGLLSATRMGKDGFNVPNAAIRRRDKLKAKRGEPDLCNGRIKENPPLSDASSLYAPFRYPDFRKLEKTDKGKGYLSRACRAWGLKDDSSSTASSTSSTNAHVPPSGVQRLCCCINSGKFPDFSGIIGEALPRALCPVVPSDCYFGTKDYLGLTVPPEFLQPQEAFFDVETYTCQPRQTGMCPDGHSTDASYTLRTDVGTAIVPTNVCPICEAGKYKKYLASDVKPGPGVTVDCVDCETSESACPMGSKSKAPNLPPERPDSDDCKSLHLRDALAGLGFFEPASIVGGGGGSPAPTAPTPSFTTAEDGFACSHHVALPPDADPEYVTVLLATMIPTVVLLCIFSVVLVAVILILHFVYKSPLVSFLSRIDAYTQSHFVDDGAAVRNTPMTLGGVISILFYASLLLLATYSSASYRFNNNVVERIPTIRDVQEQHKTSGLSHFHVVIEIVLRGHFVAAPYFDNTGHLVGMMAVDFPVPCSMNNVINQVKNEFGGAGLLGCGLSEYHLPASKGGFGIPISDIVMGGFEVVCSTPPCALPAPSDDASDDNSKHVLRWECSNCRFVRPLDKASFDVMLDSGSDFVTSIEWSVRTTDYLGGLDSKANGVIAMPRNMALGHGGMGGGTNVDIDATLTYYKKYQPRWPWEIAGWFGKTETEDERIAVELSHKRTSVIPSLMREKFGDLYSDGNTQELTAAWWAFTVQINVDPLSWELTVKRGRGIVGFFVEVSALYGALQALWLYILLRIEGGKGPVTNFIERCRKWCYRTRAAEEEEGDGVLESSDDDEEQPPSADEEQQPLVNAQRLADLEARMRHVHSAMHVLHGSSQGSFHERAHSYDAVDALWSTHTLVVALPDSCGVDTALAGEYSIVEPRSSVTHLDFAFRRSWTFAFHDNESQLVHERERWTLGPRGAHAQLRSAAKVGVLDTCVLAHTHTHTQ